MSLPSKITPTEKYEFTGAGVFVPKSGQLLEGHVVFDRLVRLTEERDHLLAQLRSMQHLSAAAFDYWDADMDSKVGKYLKAMAGYSPGYLVETDAITETLNKYE